MRLLRAAELCGLQRRSIRLGGQIGNLRSGNFDRRTDFYIIVK
jgi:hypothetical protein